VSDLTTEQARWARSTSASTSWARADQALTSAPSYP
jgi:hypothetical protein